MRCSTSLTMLAQVRVRIRHSVGRLHWLDTAIKLWLNGGVVCTGIERQAVDNENKISISTMTWRFRTYTQHPINLGAQELSTSVPSCRHFIQRCSFGPTIAHAQRWGERYLGRSYACPLSGFVGPLLCAYHLSPCCTPQPGKFERNLECRVWREPCW
jgi:hypothetical protein